MRKKSTSRYALIAALISAAGAAGIAGCGGKKEAGGPPATQQTWTSAQYKLSTTYPGSWNVSDAAITEDPRAGVVRIVIFHKPGPMEDSKSVDEYPPYVKITWTPGAAPAAGAGGETAPDEGARVMGVPTAAQGITAGWQEFGGEEIQTRRITLAGAAAEEGTALLKSGTALFSTYTGQLQGRPNRLRVVRINAAGGYYEITSIAPTEPPGELEEAGQIVNNLQFVR